MSTQLIGLQDFRKNISMLWKSSRRKRVRYIVTSHSRPIYAVIPLASAYDPVHGYSLSNQSEIDHYLDFSSEDYEKGDKSYSKRMLKTAYQNTPDSDADLFTASRKRKS